MKNLAALARVTWLAASTILLVVTSSVLALAIQIAWIPVALCCAIGSGIFVGMRSEKAGEECSLTPREEKIMQWFVVWPLMSCLKFMDFLSERIVRESKNVNAQLSAV
jgi:hypothetical protein